MDENPRLRFEETIDIFKDAAPVDPRKGYDDD